MDTRAMSIEEVEFGSIVIFQTMDIPGVYIVSDPGERDPNKSYVTNLSTGEIWSVKNGTEVEKVIGNLYIDDQNDDDDTPLYVEPNLEGLF